MRRDGLERVEIGERIELKHRVIIPAMIWSAVDAIRAELHAWVINDIPVDGR